MIFVQTQGRIACEEVLWNHGMGYWQRDGNAHLEPEDHPGHQPDAPGIKAQGGNLYVRLSGVPSN